MPTPTYTLIDSTTLASSASSVTFSSLDTIAAGYRDLICIINCATSDLAQVSFRFNGDTGNNYARVWAEAYGSSSYESQSNAGDIFGRLSDEHYSDTSLTYAGVIQVFDFAQTDKHKSVLSRSNKATGSYPGTSMAAHRWINTTAITSMTLLNAGGQTFSAGSTFHLYGIEA